MQAAYIEQTGPPEAIKIGDLPPPEPGPGQVLVRVQAVGLNPIDLYIRSGLVAMPMSFPYIIGCDFAGTVEKVGPDCTRASVGDRVWGSNQGLLGRQGVASEYACIDEVWLYPTPAALPDAEAAGMALVGITAHLGLFQFAQLKPGELVYVPGGSGGVGSMVIQMARAAGARVATSAGSAEKVELCRRSAPTSHSTTGPTTSRAASATSRPRAWTSGSRPSASPISRSRSPCFARTAG